MKLGEITDVEFLSNYWIKAKEIANYITNNLHKNVTEEKIRYGDSGLLGFVRYKDLTSWDHKNLSGDSDTLKILGKKLSYMIHMGRSNDIEPMLRKITTRRVKRFYTDYRTKDDLYERNKKYYEKTFTGIGHFRWDFGAHNLTEIEIERIEEFFLL